MADIETVRRLALALPEVEEGTWFRNPAIEADEPAEVIEDPWRRKAPKRLVAERDA